MSTDVDRTAGRLATPRRSGPDRAVGHPTRPDRRPAWPAAGVALILSWLVPYTANLVHLDWLLPPLILVGVASLLRAGRTLLDRLMLALMLLLAGVCAAGLGLSLWPWHLAPVPVAGASLTGLVLLAVLLRRRPALPLRVPWADRLLLAATAAGAATALWPFRGLSAPLRLGMVASDADFANHFALVDAIRLRGGFTFLHNDPASLATLQDGLRTYPQGAHILGALLLNFLQSTPAAGRPLAGLDLFIWFEPGAFILTILATLWALRRLAGPGLGALALLPAVALGLAYLAWTDTMMIMWLGAVPEMLALAEFAVLAAIAARPLPRIREQISLILGLSLAIGTTYFLLLPVVAVLVATWAVAHRRRLRPHWQLTAVLLLPTLAIPAVVVYVTLTTLDATSRLLRGGSIIFPSTRLLLVFTTLAACGLGLRGALRSPAWRFGLFTLAVSIAFYWGVGIVMLIANGHVSYYYFKTAHLVTVVAVIGLGPVVRALHPLVRQGKHNLVPIGLALVAVAALAPISPDGYAWKYLHRSLAVNWVGRAVYAVATGLPARPDAITVVWAGRSWPTQTTQWVNDLSRNTGFAWTGYMWVWREPYTGVLPGPDIVKFLEQNRAHPVRFVTDNATLLVTLHAIQRARPDLPLEVVDFPLP